MFLFLNRSYSLWPGAYLSEYERESFVVAIREQFDELGRCFCKMAKIALGSGRALTSHSHTAEVERGSDFSLQDNAATPQHK